MNKRRAPRHHYVTLANLTTDLNLINNQRLYQQHHIFLNKRNVYTVDSRYNRHFLYQNYLL